MVAGFRAERERAGHLSAGAVAGRNPVPSPDGRREIRTWLLAQTAFDSRARWMLYLQAMQAVIDRHDILRTAVVWEGLPEPVQVVWRKASAGGRGGVGAGGGRCSRADCTQRFDPRQYRIDLRRRRCCAFTSREDAAKGRWLMMQLQHHLMMDHTTLEVMQEEIEAHLAGEGGRLASADAVPQSGGAGAVGGERGGAREITSGRCWGTWRSRRRRSGCWMCRETGVGSRKRGCRLTRNWRGGCASARASWE